MKKLFFVFFFAYQFLFAQTDIDSIYIPTAFTPTSDGINDQFYIAYPQQTEVVKIDIYNSRQELERHFEYQKSNFFSWRIWDGKSENGALMQEGVYIVHAQFLMQGVWKERIVAVSLIR